MPTPSACGISRPESRIWRRSAVLFLFNLVRVGNVIRTNLFGGGCVSRCLGPTVFHPVRRSVFFRLFARPGFSHATEIDDITHLPVSDFP